MHVGGNEATAERRAEHSELESLARARFESLTPAESSLLRMIGQCELVICGPSMDGVQPDSEPANFAAWGPQQRIRAALLTWLCADRGARAHVHARALALVAMHIDGALDLSLVTVPFPLGFVRCALPGGLSLDYAQLPALEMRETLFAGLSGEHVSIKGDLILTGGECRGDVRLLCMQLGGSLNCSGGSFSWSRDSDSPASGIALNMQQARIGGNVNLRDGFRARGTVWLQGAEIAGVLDCNGGTVENPSDAGTRLAGLAMIADGCRIARGVGLCGDFVASGKVSFSYAEVGGIFDCSGGVFSNPYKAGQSGSGVALDMSGAKIAQGVLLRSKFLAEGHVWLAQIDIGGSLDCDAGVFRNPGGEGDCAGALVASGARIRGNVFLRQGFRAEGVVAFPNANVGLDLLFDGCIENGFVKGRESSGVAFAAPAIRIGGSMGLIAPAQLTGAVVLANSAIAGVLSCEGATFRNAAGARPGLEARAWVGDHARIGGSVLLRSGFSAEGEVRLFRAEIGGDLDCGQATFKSARYLGTGENVTALLVEGARVAGNLLLNKGAASWGQMSFYGCEIKGDANLTGARVENRGTTQASPGFAVDGRRMAVGGSLFLNHGFACQGHVALFAARIGGTLDCAGGQIHNPAVAEGAGTGLALSAEVTVTGAVLLRHGFRATGMVSLFGARIGSDFDCEQGEFENLETDAVSFSGMALRLNNATVGGSVLLRNGFVARGGVVLASTVVKGNLDLLAGRFSTLGLMNASARCLLDREENWPAKGMLALDGFHYERIGGGELDAAHRLEWLARAEPFTRAPYRQLARVLRESGDERGWRCVCVEMERRSWTRRGRSGLPASLLLRYTIGYGYFPLRALGWLLALVVLGWGVYRYGYESGLMVPSDAAAYAEYVAQRRVPGYYEPFHPVLYSLENAFPLVKLGVEDKWKPGAIGAVQAAGTPGRSRVAGADPIGTLRLFRVIQIGLGWLLTTLFVVGVTGIVRKD